MPSITSKKRQLPSIEEAWNLPISAEMSSRQQQTAQGNQQRAYTKGLSHVSSDQMVCIFSLCVWSSRASFRDSNKKLRFLFNFALPVDDFFCNLLFVQFMQITENVCRFLILPKKIVSYRSHI